MIDVEALLTQVTQSPVSLSAISAFLLVVIGTGGVIAFLKFRPESNLLSVQAAEGAMTAQGKLIADLRTELDRIKEDKDKLADRLSEIERTSQSVADLTDRVATLESEKADLLERVSHLESENGRLKAELASVQNGQNGGTA